MNQAKLLRHLLASIDLSDIKTEQYTEQETSERASAIRIFYDTYAKNEIKSLIQAQLEFTMKEAVNSDILSFSRGTVNGLILLDEWFKQQANIAISPPEGESEEPPEPIKPVGSL